MSQNEPGIAQPCVHVAPITPLMSYKAPVLLLLMHAHDNVWLQLSPSRSKSASDCWVRVVVCRKAFMLSSLQELIQETLHVCTTFSFLTCNYRKHTKIAPANSLPANIMQLLRLFFNMAIKRRRAGLQCTACCARTCKVP